MKSINSIQFSPALIALGSSVVILAASYAIWPTGVSDGIDIATFGSVSDQTWQTVKLNEQGRIVKVINDPFGLVLMMGLICACIVGVATSAFQLAFGGSDSSPAAGSTEKIVSVLPVEEAPLQQNSAVEAHLERTGLKIEEEVGGILKLLKEHLSANERFGAVLDDANKQLESITTADQVADLVAHLLTENALARTEVSKLNDGLQASQAEVETLRTSLQETEIKTMIDPLTSLKNRRWFDKNAPQRVVAAHGMKSPLSLVMADIDNFKKINDTYGHSVGDEVLKRFGEILQNNTKGRDSSVRYGGEEFTILLPHTDLSGAATVAEQLRSSLEQKRWIDQKTGRPLGIVTASFGVAQLRNDEMITDLVTRADMKLYEAKAAGKNRFVCDQ